MPLTLTQLERHLFKAADILRGKMDASEFNAIARTSIFGIRAAATGLHGSAKCNVQNLHIAFSGKLTAVVVSSGFSNQTSKE